MSSTTFRAISHIAVFALLFGMLTGCGLYKTSKTPDQGASIAITGLADVQINNFSFQPATIRIKAGTKVVWTQRDSARHNVKSNDPAAGLFESENLAQGERFEYTFMTPGTYAYHCTLHPNMTGTIIVEQ